MAILLIDLFHCFIIYVVFSQSLSYCDCSIWLCRLGMMIFAFVNTQDYLKLDSKKPVVFNGSFSSVQSNRHRRRGVSLFEKSAQILLHNADKSLVIQNLYSKNGNKNLYLNVTSLLCM